MIRLAVIGVGWAGERQIHASRELARLISVVALMDNDTDFLKAKAAELDIPRTYTHYEDVLNSPDIDAVSICTPHGLHCPMAIAAAAAGKHILVEKPIALTVEDATRMIDAADTNNVRLYVAENLCYRPIALFLRQVVQTGEYIGELTAASLVAGFRAANFGYPGRRDWLTKPGKGGTGTWMLHGIHTVAQLRYIFGEIKTVYLQEHHASSFERPDIEGTMSGLMTLQRGIHISILQSCEINLTHNLVGYTLYGDQGCLRAGLEWCEFIRMNGDPQHIPYPAVALSEYALELESFAHYVEGDMTMPTDGRSERRSLAIVQAGYESAQSGQPIHIETRFGAL